MKRISYIAWGILLVSLVALMALSPGTAHSLMLYVLAAAAVIASAATIGATLQGGKNFRPAVILAFVAAVGTLAILISLLLLSQEGAQEGDIGASGLFLLSVVTVLLAVPFANLSRRTPRP